MQYRKLGRTELMVSCIGLGGIPLAGLNEKDAYTILNTALDCNINFIDTARAYKESEELIGKAVSERRSEFFLATKTRGRGEKEIMREFETSLKNLKTQTIDLYQIHYVNTDEELEDVIKKDGALNVLKRLRGEGVIKFIGITGHDPAVLLKASKSFEFDTIQGAFSYIEKDKEVIDLINYCDRNNIGFIVQKPLAGGSITCASSGLKWILQHPVSVVIPGMLSKDQVIENTGIADGSFTLTGDEIKELDEILSKLDKIFCRRCYYCQPVCPENLRIGVILEFFGKAQFPENLDLARRWYRGIEINAENCTECDLCLSECPYNLPIVEMLKEAHEILK